MSNYDQTREPLEPDNLMLNVGIAMGWGSLIKKRPEIFDEASVVAQPYISRGAALIRDIMQGTPDTNASQCPCDVPDNQVADKIFIYIPFAMTSFNARDRGVPNALNHIVVRLKAEFPVTT